MNSNCSICGGLIKLTTRHYAEKEAPALFQLVTTCEDCGRYSIYDCVKPGPEPMPDYPDEIDIRQIRAQAAKSREAFMGPDLISRVEQKLVDDPRFCSLGPQDYINRRLTPEQEPDNVIEFTGPTRIDIAPERILKRLSNLKIDQIVAAGFLQDGSEFFASSTADDATTLWHLTRAQYKLMVEADEEGE